MQYMLLYQECMLTPGMAKKCLGPYENVKHRLQVYDLEIKDKREV